MNRTIGSINPGNTESVGFLSVVRSLPNSITTMVGHFVFLDQVPLKHYTAEEFKAGMKSYGITAHPHRGIATMSYVLQGPIEHYDSAGHRGRVDRGGLQWMKAGTGIVHEEVIVVEEQQTHVSLNGLQFWINLPAKQKAEAPDYMAVQSEDVPVISLNNGNSSIRVLIGELEGRVSLVPRYAELFLYHLILEEGVSYQFDSHPEHELAATVINGKATVNGETLQSSELMLFDKKGSTVSITGNSKLPTDIFLFGGDPYLEPVAIQGPFVMNTDTELQQAFSDYQQGNYGKIPS